MIILRANGFERRGLVVTELVVNVWLRTFADWISDFTYAEATLLVEVAASLVTPC